MLEPQSLETTGFLHGETVRYQCRLQWFVEESGNSTRTCLPDRSWSGSALSCNSE